MRVALSTLGVLLLVASLAACSKPASKGETGEKQTLTIQHRDAPAAPLPKAVGGKLAVMDNPPPPAAAPVPAAPAAPPAASDSERDFNHYASDPHSGRADPRMQDPGYGADLVDNGDPPLTRRDCQRAIRFGDPMADSRACRALLGPPRALGFDPQLVADCREARDIGDPFAASRTCRAVFER